MAKEENLECSFCGRKKSETDLLIAGTDAHICDKCIEQAHGIVEEEISEASSLSKLWDANVEGNSEALKKLSAENIESLDDAIATYGDLFSQTKEGEQEIIERLKCLI